MLQLFTLGDLRLVNEDARTLSARRAPLVLLAYLARHAPNAVARAELAALLEEGAVDAALDELRPLLGSYLDVGDADVRLDPRGLSLDVDRFEHDVDAGRDSEAVARWQGAFLAGIEHDTPPTLRRWVEAERVALQHRLSTAFSRLLDEAERSGVSGEVERIARQWVDLAPHDARAARRLRAASHARSVATPMARGDRTRHEALPRSTSESHATELTLVGRARALGLLHAAWRTARAGAPTVVVLLAERGMGSTRMCEQLARTANASDSLLLHADAGEVTAPSPPYGTASMLLQELGHAAAVESLPPESLAALAHLVPQLRTRVSALDEDAPSTQALLAATRDAIEQASRDAPVLAIVDSLSDADAESRALAADLAERLRGAALLVLALRPDDAGLALLERLRHHAPSVRVLALEPLSVDDVALLLDATVPMPAADRLELAREIHTETRGVPRYVASEVETLRERGMLRGGTTSAGGTRLSALEGHHLPVPPAVRADLERRIRGLDDTARRTLEAAAVLSGPFAAADVARLTGQSPSEASRTLALLVQQGFVVTTDGRHAIEPPLVERALYSLIPPPRREALHAAAAKLPAGTRPWHRITETIAPVITAAAPDAVLSTPRRIRWLVAVGILLVAALAAVAVVVARRSGSGAPLARSVLIFPFEVRGGTVAYLESGMMDLLSTSLDGVGGYRTVDPRVVLASLRARAGRAALAPDEARRVAARFGATYFVLGSVTATGGRLQVSATMHDMRREGTVVARASAFGAEGAIFAIIDRVTAQLAVAQGAASGERLAQLAAVTTNSLDALKAYLEGRAAYRSNDLTRALPAFERAVAADSTFALAWYGMATTASWMLRSALEQQASLQAVRQAGRLSARDRTLVEAMAAYAHGSADSAETKARAIAETYDDLEAWVLLGEVLFHHNWKRGRSMSESRRAWERVLALDPKHWPAMQHLSEVAAVEGRTEAADSLLGRYEREVGTEHMLLASRALRAHLSADSAKRAALRPLLAADNGFFLVNSVFYVSVFAGDIEGAKSLARLMLGPQRSPEQQGLGRVLLAHLALAQGRWREARMELALARTLTPVDAVEHRLLLTLAPFVAAPDSTIARERAELMALSASSAGTSSAASWPRPHARIHPLLRAYLAGLASARIGEDAPRQQALRELETLPDPTGATALARGLAESVRAEAAMRAGSRDEALSALERGALRSAFVPAWTSPVVSQAYERWRRAELLRELGRHEEALRWYGTFGENSPYDLVYLGPALYWQGRLLEQRGDRAAARARFTRFVALWKDADPELLGMVEDARGRLR